MGGFSYAYHPPFNARAVQGSERSINLFELTQLDLSPTIWIQSLGSTVQHSSRSKGRRGILGLRAMGLKSFNCDMVLTVRSLGVE